MHLSMIFFTIIIERKKRTSEEVMASLHLKQIIKERKDKHVKDLSSYPSYCTRL
ncbi:YrzI family small protein [Brevibacillus ginsengisoli]|uniref:YrzI family small protein n=1 Tax=Brevibacillus ginsengisoli TaxID=363854 RepID=UPI003CF0684C